MQTAKEDSLWRRIPIILTTPVSELFGGKRDSETKRRAQPAATDHRALTLEGAIARGKETNYAVNGVDFAVREETWVFGELEYGAKAKVFYALLNGKGRVAQKIVILAPPPKNI